ncbi:MAG TPA: ABC transporter ATP-binding protein [Thermoanaerobaculia bacterium]|nr:ABC transporter ATP-binding protein [Thermoanaerobaculia bacterium]
MSETVIHAENLGKRYRIGAARRRHNTLRDALAEGGPALVRSLTARLGRAAAGRSAEAIWALEGVSFEVRRGEAVGVVGSNGAGKSTLLKVLSRITEPTTGWAEIHGRVGSLLEVGTGFHSELTGRENVFLSGAILGMRRAEIRRRFDEIIDFAEVATFIDTPVKHYSSGMYLRLAFAVAAHLEPEILLVDEVLAVGDAAFQKRCLGKMGDVTREGRTVLFVSHNLNAVQRLCPRCLLLEGGELTASGPTAHVVARYLTNHAAAAAPGEWIDLSRVARVGTGEVRLEAMQYTSRNPAAAFQPYPDGPLDFLLSIAARRPSALGSLALTLYDRNGSKLVNVDTLALGKSLELREGTTRVRLEIEELHLNPGAYSLGFWLADRGGTVLDFADAALDLEVVELEREGFGTRPASDGMVPCRFTVRAEAE